MIHVERSAITARRASRYAFRVSCDFVESSYSSPVVSTPSSSLSIRGLSRSSITFALHSSMSSAWALRILARSRALWTCGQLVRLPLLSGIYRSKTYHFEVLYASRTLHGCQLGGLKDHIILFLLDRAHELFGFSRVFAEKLFTN